jgi:hypothetical protein
MDRGYFIPQTGHAEFSEDAVTIKAEYRFLLFPPYWDLSVGSFFTASPLSTNQSGVDARFLGVNLRLGYRLPFIHEPFIFLAALIPPRCLSRTMLSVIGMNWGPSFFRRFEDFLKTAMALAFTSNIRPSRAVFLLLLLPIVKSP